METLKNFLWPIILVGGLGGLIDFLIGKAGQEKAKDLLLKWWVRFDDVHWRNFGREEGIFAGQLIEQWFGRKTWSYRRLAAAFLIYIVFSIIHYFIADIMRRNQSLAMMRRQSRDNLSVRVCA
jgi:hypothetical protein